MKPVIFYVDDEPHNLSVFSAALPSDWKIYTFTHPLEALERIEALKPWVILTDQRMPEITGVQFLELVRKLDETAVRIVVTGYSDEDLIIESVRKAQVFDYIRKPWDSDELQASVQRAIEFYRLNKERVELMRELKRKNSELTELTVALQDMTSKEGKMRRELECWVPPCVLWALNDEKMKFPIKKEIVGITFDIIDSGKLHNINILGRPIRALVLQAFSEAVIKNGGWKESQSGDSAYGHFGAFDNPVNPYEAALAAAREFRVALRSLTKVHQISVECGIALHVCRDSVIDIHVAQIGTPKGTVVQKSFDTTSRDIDLLHRMEKLVHGLPGSNIILSEAFLKNVQTDLPTVFQLGPKRFSNELEETTLYLIPSDLLSKEDLEKFKASFLAGTSTRIRRVA